MMSAELYYLVGKPNSLKQDLISVLRKSLSNQPGIIVPEIFTTDKLVAENDNFIYVDERNFRLRQSMDLYSLSWVKKDQLYGVNGDLTHRLNSGADVILNGSLHNLDQVKYLYPNVNTIVIKNLTDGDESDNDNYLIAENDEVKLEWESKDKGLGHPYVLTLMSGHCMENAIEMILSLIIYNRNSLDYTA